MQNGAIVPGHLNLKCDPCDTIWQALKLPAPIAEVANAAQKAKCPKCGGKASTILAEPKSGAEART